MNKRVPGNSGKNVGRGNKKLGCANRFLRRLMGIFRSVSGDRLQDLARRMARETRHEFYNFRNLAPGDFVA